MHRPPPQKKHPALAAAMAFFAAARKLSRHLGIRLAVYFALIFAGWRFPGALKWIPYLLAFAAGIWAFRAIVRDLPSALEFVARRFASAWHACGHFLRPGWHGWKWIYALAAAAVIAAAAIQAWPTWSFLATSSLREDETLNVIQYTSRGFAKAVGEYSLARNHILFNVLNSLLPGADSVWPLRARFLSFLSVAAGLVFLTGYAARRGWAISGALCASLVAINLHAMKSLLEARGYGMIFFFSVAASVAFAEWARTRHRAWLIALAAAVVAGNYTLPYFVLFGGTLLLAAFAARPSRQTFGVGFLAACATAMLYLPVAAKVASVAAGYGDDYEGRSTFNFNNLDSILRGIQFFIPYDTVEIAHWGLPALLCAALAFVWLGHPRFARTAVAGVSCAVLVVMAAFLALGSVPLRAGSFLGGPHAFIAATILGALASSRSLRNLQPALQLGLAGGGIALLMASTPVESLIPRQDWRGIAKILDASFPPDTRIWTQKSYAPLIQWNLSDRRELENGQLDREALASGKLVAVDSEFHNRSESKRLGYKDLPESARFITVPLLLNYNRIYFVPPPPDGIVSATFGKTPVPVEVPGWQVPSIDLFDVGSGHGDTLLKNPPPTENTARPSLFSLPDSLEVRIRPAAGQNQLNLLLSRGLGNVEAAASWQDDRGRWHETRAPKTMGEFLSIPIPDRECRVLRLSFSPKNGRSGEKIGLLAAWLSGGR